MKNKIDSRVPYSECLDKFQGTHFNLMARLCNTKRQQSSRGSYIESHTVSHSHSPLLCSFLTFRYPYQLSLS